MNKKLTFICCLILGGLLIGAACYFYPRFNQKPDPFVALLNSAQQGRETAQLKVAEAYLFGDGVEQNVFRAIYWFAQAANKGNAEAAYALAEIYLVGDQVPQDIESGLEYLKQSVRENYAPALYMLGNLYRDGGAGIEQNVGQALWMWRLAMDKGDPRAQDLFEKAKEQYPDLAAQIEELFDQKKQAFKNSNAALFVAEEYKSGEHIAQNDRRWLKWLEKSAELGNTKALYELYRLYMEDNPFVEKDEKRALKYLHLAAEKGLAEAQYKVGLRIYEHPKDEDSYQVAWQWFSLAAKQGYPDAIYMSGIMRMKGLAGEQNPAVAIFSFQHAAELGQVNAQYILGKCYLEGIGVEKDTAEAKKWLNMAAQNGNKEASKLLKTIK